MSDKSNPQKRQFEMKGITIRKIVACLFGVAILSISILIYNHKQDPGVKDVFHSTKNWSPQTQEVYLVEKINGKWLTIFRNLHSVLIGELEQNWLGSWGIKEVLASTYYPPGNEDVITWGASGKDQKGYYFGQLVHPEIQNIKIKFGDDIYYDALIINANGEEFFLKEIEEGMVFPVDIKAFSASGEVIYSSVRE